MAETINNLEVSIGQLKDSREKGMRDVVKEKERLQEEVTKAMHKVRMATNFNLNYDNMGPLYVILKVMKIEEEKSKLEMKSSTESQDLQRTIAKLKEDISSIAEERDDYSQRLDEAVSDKDKNVSEQVEVQF